MKKYIILALVVCMLFLVACTKNKPVTDVGGESGIVFEKVNEPEETSKEITLYFSDNQGMALCKELRTVSSKEASDPEFVIKELFAGTKDETLISVIPSATKVNSCVIEDGVCVVDLSVDFIEIQGSTAQEMAMYSVVNTLCGVEGVESVRFLIDGNTVPVFGVFDFASELTPNMSIVKE